MRPGRPAAGQRCGGGPRLGACGRWRRSPQTRGSAGCHALRPPCRRPWYAASHRLSPSRCARTAVDKITSTLPSPQVDHASLMPHSQGAPHRAPPSEPPSQRSGGTSTPAWCLSPRRARTGSHPRPVLCWARPAPARSEAEGSRAPQGTAWWQGAVGCARPRGVLCRRCSAKSRPGSQGA